MTFKIYFVIIKESVVTILNVVLKKISPPATTQNDAELLIRDRG